MWSCDNHKIVGFTHNRMYIHVCMCIVLTSWVSHDPGKADWLILNPQVLFGVGPSNWEWFRCGCGGIGVKGSYEREKEREEDKEMHTCKH